MKVLEIIDSLPCGEVVPLRVLAVFKRCGLIGNYSSYGYLEDMSDAIPWSFYYKGRKFRTKYLSGCFSPYVIKAEDVIVKKRTDYIQFKGDFVKDRTCFVSDKIMGTLWSIHHKFPNISWDKFYEYMARKEKVFAVPTTRTNRKVNRTISAWGCII